MLKFISPEPLDLDSILAQAQNDKAGAIVVFSGQVRNHHNGRSVDWLEYEAHEEMAELGISQILKEANEKWELHFVFCQHRVGKVNLGQSAVIVVTSSSHRQSAYEANIFIIDKVKAEVPIWKKEFFSDGNQVWL